MKSYLLFGLVFVFLFEAKCSSTSTFEPSVTKKNKKETTIQTSSVTEEVSVEIPEGTENPAPIETGDPEIVECTAGKIVCGGTDSCYDNEKATKEGKAITPTCKKIVYQEVSQTLHIWKEQDGDKILEASGYDFWQMKLNEDGKGFGDDFFVDLPKIAGRVCPPNIYLDDSNKFIEKRCLFFDGGNPAQTLSKDGTTQPDGYTTHLANEGKWYSGNINTCKDKGMRLPTLYETTSTNTDYLPSQDGSPVFAKESGVPAVDDDNTPTWSATAMDGAPYHYWRWPGYGNDHFDSSAFAIRCVLP